MAAPLSNIRLAEHHKLITTTGEFWVQGKLLGKGKWENKSRFTVLVSAWGDRWWVGALGKDGMHTASVLTEEEAKHTKPTHYEEFSGIDLNAPKTDIRLDEHDKLIMRTGEFYQNAKLIGYGKWEPEGKFIVFVSAWGDRWWVGVLVNGGMKTASPKTEEETQTIKPNHLEKFSVPFPDAPKADIRLTENNKLITPYGEFFVNGALLARGQWEPEGKFLVLVESWGSTRWVGVIVAGGMNTAAFKSEEEAATTVPTHFEKFGRDPDAPSADVKLAERNKLIKTTGEFFIEGSLVGYGRWEPKGKFIVFVKTFEKWWVGVIVKNGMNTMVFKTETEAETGRPTHFEPFA